MRLEYGRRMKYEWVKEDKKREETRYSAMIPND